MKFSRYNKLFEFENTFYGFNCLTTSLAVFDSTEVEAIRTKDPSQLKEPSVKQMKKHGFLVEDSFDELAEVRRRFEEGREDPEVLWLTITPTSTCNFACVYCFESLEMRQNRRTLMSKEVQGQLIDYVKTVNPHMTALRITWYGGEPTLGIGVISSLSKEFIEFCSERNIEYRAGIITNGYLLTPVNLKALKEAKVTDMQVTIDGPKETHDRRRFLRGGQPTYDVIMKNVEHCCLNYPEISIEINVNVDKSNKDAVLALANDLESRGIKDKMFFNLNPVEEFDNADQNTGNDGSLGFFTQREFSDFSIQIREKFDTNGFRYTLDYPVQIYNHCGVNKRHFTLIDGNGDLYRCWNDLGIRARATGHIDPASLDGQEVPERGARMQQYMQYNPVNVESCKNCDVLPICVGGCYSQKLRNGVECSVAERADFKYNLEHVLKMFIKRNTLN